MAKKMSAAEMLKGVKKSASATTPAAKKDTRPVWVIDQKENPDVVDLVQLSTITDQLESSRKEHDKAIKAELLERFIGEWWDKKKKPENPRIVIRKLDASGKVTSMDDMSFMFMVKYRSAGLSNVVPNAEDLPQGKTAEDVLLEMLQVAVGISEQKALALLNEDDGEITVVDQLQLAADFDSLLNNDATSSAATKLLTYLMTNEDKKVPSLTPEEKESILQTKQVVTLKEGFFERAHMYVESADQLLKLINFVKATLQISSYEFAISDTPIERTKRLSQVANEYLMQG